MDNELVTERPVLDKPVEPPITGGALPWKSILWFFLLLCALYFPVLRAMGREWIELEEMGHGFFVPVVAAYVAWQDRENVLKQRIAPSWFGVLLLVWGFLQMLLGTFGADFFISRTAFLVSLAGLIWTLCGWPVVRSLMFPLVLLLFMIRLPQLVYSQVTFPLQLFASSLAENVLSLLGIPVLRDGNVLELASQRLSVVEACSGIRSLISLSFLSLVYAYFFDAKKWMRGVLLLASIPIAIIANAGRVTITGILSEYDTKLAQGAYHTFEGWVIFIAALVMLVLAHKVINAAWSWYSARNVGASTI